MNPTATITETENGWQSYALGSLARFINGRAFKPAEWSDEGLPIIRIQNLTRTSAEANHFAGEVDSKHRIDDGDLLVSWSASLDAFLWQRGPAALNQHIFKVEEDSQVVDREFLYLVLKAAMSSIRGAVHGSTMQHITKPKFEATRVQIPADLAEQRRLANLLQERLTDVERMAAAAVAQREAAFAATGAVLHRALEEAHGGQVEEVPLGSILTLCQYGSSTASNKDGLGMPMLRMGNIVDNRLDYTDLVHVELEDKDLTKLKLERGDVLITRTNGSPQLVGKSALFDRDEAFVFASYLIRLRVDPARCHPEYLQAVLSSSIGRAYIDKVKHQVGQFNINATDIKGMPFPLPDLGEQQRALDAVRAAQPTIDEMVGAAETAIDATRALPDAILRATFEPELADAESEVADA
jgi:type I restriction enzyme, S subunit